MKLADLVAYFRTGSTISDLIQRESLDAHSDQIVVYLKDSLDINSELVFIEIEKTNDDIELVYNEKRYVGLFSLGQTHDIILDYLHSTKNSYSNIEIAENILNYRINDA
jgi:hypothetical protein